MPLSELDKQQVGAFLGALLRGEAELGFGAMSMIKLYNVANKEKVDLFELIVRDPETTKRYVAALRKRARELPAATIKQIEQIVIAAKS